MASEFNDQLVLNSVSARALKAHLVARISEIVDEMVVRKCPGKKKLQAKRQELRIPVDLIQPEFVKRFGLCGYKNGVLVSLLSSLVENNFFPDGKLDPSGAEELILTDIERKIISMIPRESPLYIDSGDVKTLTARLRSSASEFEFRGETYRMTPDKIEDIINQMLVTDAIRVDEKSSSKDSVYVLDDELLDVLKSRLFRCPQVKDNCISRTRLYDYFSRVTKPDESRIYVILRDPCIARALGVESVTVGEFTYTKYTMLVNALSAHVDRYSKRFSDGFYESISEFVKDNEKVNISRVVEYLTVPNVTLSCS
ncbi:encapsidated DNA-binding protein [Squirrelpox virus]|uniref:Encapsidated DNA-binding protein n=1 Tax=Squirrelpox virus TaxID=240426 RepID=U3UBF9_9POXV|nr:encapsidated DNA-binding protein [Squirrelpox virus]CCD83219.1 encapsidated DNA-binding protein [Squirrelpox virus]